MCQVLFYQSPDVLILTILYKIVVTGMLFLQMGKQLSSNFSLVAG
jgi:hypothetical protein